MSIYRYAGATLALAGIIDQQQQRYSLDAMHPRAVTDCVVCRAFIRNKLTYWLDQQNQPSRWRPSSPSAPSDLYWMAA